MVKLMKASNIFQHISTRFRTPGIKWWWNWCNHPTSSNIIQHHPTSSNSLTWFMLFKAGVTAVTAVTDVSLRFGGRALWMASGSPAELWRLGVSRRRTRLEHWWDPIPWRNCMDHHSDTMQIPSGKRLHITYLWKITMSNGKQVTIITTRMAMFNSYRCWIAMSKKNPWRQSMLCPPPRCIRQIF